MPSFVKKLNDYYGLYCRVEWEDIGNSATNTSTCKITKVELAASNISGTHYASGSISIGGTTVYSFSSVAFYTSSSSTGYNRLAGITGHKQITHQADGSAQVEIAVTISAVYDLEKDPTALPNVVYIRVPWSHYSNTTVKQKVDLPRIPRGIIHIDNGSSFDDYQVFVDNGSSWDQYTPYIDNGSSWDMCG